MRRKILSAIAASALMCTSTVASAQMGPAPEPATERVTEGSALDDDETLGVIFGLLVLIVLIWKLGDKDDIVATSP